MPESDFVGKYVIVRTYSSGAFAGHIEEFLPNDRIIIGNVRRLWRWHTANNGLSLSEVATYGINQEKSKITCAVTREVLKYEEILECTDEAHLSIAFASEYIA